MLCYIKKYHRSYISLFKLGAKFRHFYGNLPVETVEEEPLYSDSHDIEVRGHYLWWKLIDFNGIINKYIHVI